MKCSPQQTGARKAPLCHQFWRAVIATGDRQAPPKRPSDRHRCSPGIQVLARVQVSQVLTAQVVTRAFRQSQCPSLKSEPHKCSLPRIQVLTSSRTEPSEQQEQVLARVPSSRQSLMQQVQVLARIQMLTVPSGRQSNKCKRSPEFKFPRQSKWSRANSAK